MVPLLYSKTDDVAISDSKIYSMVLNCQMFAKIMTQIHNQFW